MHVGNQISRVDVIPYRMPVRRLFVWGRGWTIAALEYAVVKVTTDDGVVGFGEAAPSIDSLGDTQRSVVEVITKHLAEAMVGESVFAVDVVGARFDLVSRNFTAKAACEMAITDAACKTLGVPLWEYLGGARREVPLVWMAGADSVERVRDEVLAAQDRGFSWFKIKTGSDVDDDIKLVRVVRDALGPLAHIFADPNEQYDERAYLRFARECADVAMDFVEEPIAWRNNPRRREVLATAGLPVLADESAQTFARAVTEIESGPSALVSLKPPRNGYSEIRFLARLCAVHAKTPWIGSHAESDLGALLCAHAAAGLAPFTGAAEIAFYQSLDGHLLADTLPHEGVIRLPDAPGIGKEVDESELERYSLL